MAPSQTLDYIRNSAMDNAVYSSNAGMSLALFRSSANIKNLGIRKGSLATAFAKRTLLSRHSVSAFAQTIMRIVRLCAEKQMRRIHAISHVALVEHLQTIGNGAVMQFPRCAMRSDYTTCDVNPAIPSLLVWFIPQPAIIGAALVYFFPESFFQGANPCVTRDESYRMAFNRPIARRCLFGEWRELPATAVAITVRDFLRGIMGMHRNLSFLVPSLGHLTMLPGTLHWFVLG